MATSKIIGIWRVSDEYTTWPQKRFMITFRFCCIISGVSCLCYWLKCASIDQESRYNDEQRPELIEIVYDSNVNQLRGRMGMPIYEAWYTLRILPNIVK